MRLLACTALLITAGCAERNESLPNGYRFIELSRGNGAIVKESGDFAVFPNVVEYRVRGSVVVGRRILARDNADDSADFTANLGYFEFNTITGGLRQGLREEPDG